MVKILSAVLINTGIALILLMIWMLIPRKSIFKKIADFIEHIIDTIINSFP